MRRLLPTALVLLAACDDPFVPQSVLATFRPLALRAEPPQVQADQPARLSALLYDPLGRELEHTWLACDPAGDAPSPCLAREVIGGLETGALDPRGALVPGLRLLGTATTATYAGAREGTAIVLLVATAGRERVVAQKELDVTPARPNANPELELVLLGSRPVAEGEVVGVRPGISVTWSAIVTSTSAELFERRAPSGSTEVTTEDLRYMWFTTQGRYGTSYRPPSVKPVIDRFVDAGPPPRDAGPREGGGESSNDELGMKVTLNLPDEPETGDNLVRVFVVVRDGRGGATWAERAVRMIQ